jgi:hypothetical protein
MTDQGRNAPDRASNPAVGPEPGATEAFYETHHRDVRQLAAVDLVRGIARAVSEGEGAR